MNDASARQQIVEKIQDSNNILVTVSRSPSVDELSAALGLTVMLNAMNKHATAIFSGDVPPAIDFLRPGKTFENTVDSLRDFIIALDKEKADHLRYKVDGDVVKIFITPYRTVIGEKDLDFSQGDYNVELVLALGVTSQDQLDTALEAHGRIFHDATVATLTVGGDKSDLGSLGWNERSVSSLSEMVTGLSEVLRQDKNLLDEQTATALLTGIVATTDRFSNKLTSPKTMTIAAQLMAAGANQQLIATKLEEAHEIKTETNENSDGSTNLTEGKPSKVAKNQNQKATTKKKQPEVEEKKANTGELLIAHEKRGSLDEVGEQTAKEDLSASAERAEQALSEQNIPPMQTEPKTPEQELESQLASITNQPAGDKPSVSDLQKDIAAASADVDEAAQAPAPAPVLPPPAVSTTELNYEPTLGGTLNATTEQAAADKRREDERDRNKTILSHEGNSYMGGQTPPSYNVPLNAAMDPTQAEVPVSDPMNADTQPTIPVAPIMPPTNNPGVTLAQLDKENRAPHDDARDAISAAFATQDQVQQQTPATAFGSETIAPPPMPPMPDFSTLPPLPPQLATSAPAHNDSFQFEQTPAQSPVSQSSIEPSAATQQSFTPPPVQPTNSVADPGQFKIPGQ